MFEKVNPKHPDKVADRIGGAFVDLAYKKQENPKIAGEVLLGHGSCSIIIETSVDFTYEEIKSIVYRIVGESVLINYKIVPQDPELAKNQEGDIRCGDSGIFKGTPISEEEKELTQIAKDLYEKYDSDGKYILDKEQGDRLIICQSNAKTEALKKAYPISIINPLGDWTGGIDVDCGCCNRKLGSDMGAAATGGGLHFKDLSKADVSVNIYCHLKATALGQPYELNCAIGDEFVDGRPYSKIVQLAKDYIDKIGGFEKFAEWGLIR
jgi:S-adenosylmethionine synthetase